MPGKTDKYLHKEVVSSSQVKNVLRRLEKKRSKLKSKSHGKVTQASSSKRKVAAEGKGRCSSGGNILKKEILQKAESSKKQSVLSCQGEDNLKHENLDTGSEKLKRRRKKRRRKRDADPDDVSPLQRRTRYLLIKMKLEQNLIDAYSAEGWKGQSREKIRPEKELQRAKKQILNCKLGIREIVHHLDLLSSAGQIDDSAIAPDGSVHHDHIICAKCKLQEAFSDNDIILCDGTCNCAFHQKCLDPPLSTENIPPDDEGWFCKFCKCKMEIIEATNAHIGTHFAMDSNWEDIFKEEALRPEGEESLLCPEQDWPSDDSEDDDYDPEKVANSHSSTDSFDSGSSSEGSSGSMLESLEDELLALTGKPEGGSSGKDYLSKQIAGLDYEETTDVDVLSAPRQRRAVDYIKLNDEMFGKHAPAIEQNSEDEDWGPGKRKRRRKESESDAASTLITLFKSEKSCSEKTANKVEKESFGRPAKREIFRIPPDAVEELRRVFAENELPSRDVRENLSKKLGIEYEKVNKWFKNARYIALKARKQAESTKPCEVTSPTTSVGRIPDTVKGEPADHISSSDAEENAAQAPKNLGRSPNEETPNLVIRPSKKKHVKKAVKQSTYKVETVVEFGDDMSLKLLRERAKKERRKLNFKEREKIQEAEAEMQKLCRIKDKIARLQDILLRFPNHRCRRAGASSLDESLVVFIPFAELQDKR
ncbi:Pathogenesis-related homeodomain protein [Capsicum annuum]|uniref:Pathogenesis-related homeodomain protein n=1 Tax=Capsicum annuum TaxID=4072 RepID=A0A1U8H9N2_CAPAN|nr:pathogenesis-related homeodomain protein isoform X1 [Capsicum annuum]XP_016580060.1 pathogenesis-related homeodomain protein isoform X1 [Capsicum annuum]XP_016580061.1 pathogenesis-related homeodomain protein isoform X1 [Capsicum annuum]XP_047249595.1 pathogenesis-related homeodomain protein isoform X1 [Capsicum annuum]KAF3632346.1 Pathogenesis-related homeodomain protein [Capsicum annuum]KAF3681611.1 Pathogenesis-related homeodomain protein [Capsicum annuum]PHT75708.1 Pathogenesis-related